MKDGKVCVGVIGVGFIGRAHLKAYKSHNDVEVLAVSDPYADLLGTVADDFGIEKRFGDYRELLGVEEIDCVSVCTPNFLHAPVAKDALSAGKNVLCEKPLASDLEASLGLEQTVKVSDKKFMIAFNNRFAPHSLILKDCIDKGMLGEIYHINASWIRGPLGFEMLSGWFTEKAKSGGGPLIDLGVHLIDLANYFIGQAEPVSVFGSVYSKFGIEYFKGKEGRMFDVEDFAVGMIRFDNAATLTVRVSWGSYADRPDETTLSLYGTKGGANWTPLRIVGKIDEHLGEFMPNYDASNAWDMSITNETRHFIDCVKDDKAPVPSVEQGVRIMKIVDALYKSSEKGEEIKL